MKLTASLSHAKLIRVKGRRGWAGIYEVSTNLVVSENTFNFSLWDLTQLELFFSY